MKHIKMFLAMFVALFVVGTFTGCTVTRTKHLDGSRSTLVQFDKPNVFIVKGERPYYNGPDIVVYQWQYVDVYGVDVDVDVANGRSHGRGHRR